MSAEEKLEQVGVQLSGRSVRALQHMQRKVEYQKEHAKDQNTMTHKLVTKGRQAQEHLRYIRSSQTTARANSTSKGGDMEHSYSKWQYKLPPLEWV